jgi:FdhE protein
LSALAKGHPAEPYLELLATIARGQDDAVREIRLPPRSRPGPVPLAHEVADRDPAWHVMLRVILSACRGAALPAPARVAINRLEAAGAAELEALATEVLAGPPRDLASAPFVGAALQTYLTQLAANERGSGVEALPVEDSERTACPVCGSPPVAAVVLGTERLRYLVCSLCASEWHHTRAQCFLCRSGEATSYYSVEGAPKGAGAETCDTCKTYLKVFDLQDVTTAEALADDAASLVLDLLLGEQGYRRAGVNLLAPAGEPG